MTWEAIAAFFAIWITVVSAAIIVTRKLSEVEINLRKYTDDQVEKSKAQLLLSVDHSRSYFAESVKAAREHANLAHGRVDAITIEHQKLELYIRDNYVEVDSFNEALGRIEKAVDKLWDKMDKMLKLSPQG